MRVSPEAPPWQPPPAKQSTDHVPSQENAAVAVEDSDNDSDEGETFEFNFDLDAQINAAMASLTESAQATVASPAISNVQLAEPTTPVEQQQQQQPTEEALPASNLQPSSPPSQAAKEVNAEADLTLKDAPTQAQEKAVDDDSDEEEEDEDDAAAAAAQFDLDAMLASAMGQAVSAAESDPVSTGNASKEVPSTPEQPERQATALRLSDESDEDDEEEEPAFDLDAHLRQAMALAREQAPLSPGEEVVDVGTPLGPPSSDESSDDEDVNFDLDAQIGAALADQLLESVKEQGTPREGSQGPPAALPAAKEPSPDFMAHDLQNMLQAAMKQAALELEIEQQEQTTQLEGLTIAAKEQAQAFPGQPLQPPPFVPRRFAMPPKPRTRPRVEDDGDPENAYNKSRQSHPQALHTPYKCDFKGCDKVVSGYPDAFFRPS